MQAALIVSGRQLSDDTISNVKDFGLPLFPEDGIFKFCGGKSYLQHVVDCYEDKNRQNPMVKIDFLYVAAPLRSKKNN